MKACWLVLGLLASCEGCGAEASVPPPPPSMPAGGPGTTAPRTEGTEAQAEGQPSATGEASPAPPAEPPVSPGDPGSEPDPPAQPTTGPAPPEPLVTRAELATLDRAACHRLLRREGVLFRALEPERAEGVEMPILLSGEVDGVEVRYRGRRERNSILDCRLAVALAGWMPALRSVGVERVEHMSIYRPGSRVRTTGRRSGHAAGAAIDVSHLVRPDEGTLEVERDWSDKTLGAEPCAERADEPDGQRLLRALVCEAVEADLFQVVVTPHGNRRHHNHVHLEIRPEVDWTHVR